MDEEGLKALTEVLQQINDLSGAALEALLQGAEGSGPDSGAPAPEQGAPPAPPQGE